MHCTFNLLAYAVLMFLSGESDTLNITVLGLLWYVSVPCIWHLLERTIKSFATLGQENCTENNMRCINAMAC